MDELAAEVERLLRETPPERLAEALAALGRSVPPLRCPRCSREARRLRDGLCYRCREAARARRWYRAHVGGAGAGDNGDG